MKITEVKRLPPNKSQCQMIAKRTGKRCGHNRSYVVKGSEGLHIQSGFKVCWQHKNKLVNDAIIGLNGMSISDEALIQN